MAAKTDKYMRIECDFFDALCLSNLSGSETRVLFYILRRTILCTDKSSKDQVKYTLIFAREISNYTKLPKRTVSKCISALTKKKIVLSEKAKDALADKRDVSCFSGERLYGINFQTGTWVL